MRRIWWPVGVLLSTACKEPSDRDDTAETVLITGPALMSGDPPGDTGLAGPLTDCVTGFPPG